MDGKMSNKDLEAGFWVGVASMLLFVTGGMLLGVIFPVATYPWVLFVALGWDILCGLGTVWLLNYIDKKGK